MKLRFVYVSTDRQNLKADVQLIGNLTYDFRDGKAAHKKRKSHLE